MAFIIPALVFVGKYVGGPVLSAVTSAFIVPAVLKTVSNYLDSRNATPAPVPADCDPDLC